VIPIKSLWVFGYFFLPSPHTVEEKRTTHPIPPPPHLMVLTVEGCTRLVAWAALVMFEIYSLSDKKRGEYDREMMGIRMPAYQIPSWVFAWVWYSLKALIVASMYFYMEYAINVNDWTFPTVFALVFAMVVFSKFWMPLFFKQRAYGASALLALILACHAVAAMVIMVITSNEGTLWALPFALFVPVTAWYVFAALLSFEWYRLKCVGTDGYFAYREQYDCYAYEEQQPQQSDRVMPSAPPVVVTPVVYYDAPPQKKHHRFGHSHSAHGEREMLRHPIVPTEKQIQMK